MVVIVTHIFIIHYNPVRSFSALEQLTGSKYFRLDILMSLSLFSILMLFVFINVLLTLVALVTIK